LRDLGVGTDSNGAIALPLASFNGGVEVGQMAVAVVLVPLFWWLRLGRLRGFNLPSCGPCW
jgi:hypothetical protein